MSANINKAIVSLFHKGLRAWGKAALEMAFRMMENRVRGSYGTPQLPQPGLGRNIIGKIVFSVLVHNNASLQIVTTECTESAYFRLRSLLRVSNVRLHPGPWV